MKMMSTTTFRHENNAMNGPNQTQHEEADMIDQVFENLTSSACPLPDDLEQVLAHEQQQEQERQQQQQLQTNKIKSKNNGSRFLQYSHRGRKKSMKKKASPPPTTTTKTTLTDDVAATATAQAAALAAATSSALAAASDAASKVTSSVMTVLPSSATATTTTIGDNQHTETIVALEAAATAGLSQDDQDALDRLCTPLEKCCLGAGGSSSAAAAAAMATTTTTTTTATETAVGQTNTTRNNQDGGDPFVSDEPTINRTKESSLVLIAARMKDIDLESATDVNDESSDDHVIDDDKNDPNGNATTGGKDTNLRNSRRGRSKSQKRSTKDQRIRRHSSRGRRNKTPWYKDRMYATLIILCILFTIAIITMTVLLVFA